MPGSAAKVVITERQHVVLRKMSTATTLAKRLVQRATIILLAFAGLTNEAIAGQVGLERHQIGIWRRRWQRVFNNLVRIECTEDAPAALARHEAPGRRTAPRLSRQVHCRTDHPAVCPGV
jgi:putative transposase